MHFPDYYDKQYFEGLISEEKRIEWAGGQPRIRWLKKEGSTKRNEPLDVRVYALAALRSIPMGLRLGAMRRREYALKDKEPKEEEEKAQPEETDNEPEAEENTVEEARPSEPGKKDRRAERKEAIAAKKSAAVFRRNRNRGGGGWSIM
jgi:phage terminase large subunit GpA-like protein